MNEALKTVENLMMFVQNELNRISNNPQLSDEAFVSLNKAKNFAIATMLQIQQAHAYQTTEAKK